MISVPEAALLPKYPRPVRRAKSSSRDGGKPRGYVRNGRSSITPQISQCPVVESFPCDLGSATPCAAVGLTPGASPGMGRHLPKPSRSRFGSRSPPTARATFPSVSDPTRSEEHTSELQSLAYLVCRLLLEKKKKNKKHKRDKKCLRNYSSIDH